MEERGMRPTVKQLRVKFFYELPHVLQESFEF